MKNWLVVVALASTALFSALLGFLVGASVTAARLRAKAPAAPPASTPAARGWTFSQPRPRPASAAEREEHKAALAAAGVAYQGLGDEEIDRKYEEVAREKMFVPGRYDCPDSVTYVVKPYGAVGSVSAFHEQKLPAAFTRAEGSTLFGGVIQCLYRTAGPIALTTRAAGAKALVCPQAAWSIDRYADAFPAARGWWHTPQARNPQRTTWDAKKKTVTCVYADEWQGASMTTAAQFRSCAVDGHGFDCK